MTLIMKIFEPEEDELIEYNGFYIQLKYDMPTFSYSAIIRDSNKNEVDTIVDLDNEDDAIEEGKEYIDTLVHDMIEWSERSEREWEDIFPVFDDNFES